MVVNTTPSVPITINNNSTERVDDFMCLELREALTIAPKKYQDQRILSLISVRKTLCSPSGVLKSILSNKRTKNTHLHNNNVKPVLLYSSECCCIIQNYLQKIELFQKQQAPQNPRNIFAKEDQKLRTLRKCKCQSIETELKQRRFSRFGQWHVFRMANHRLFPDWPNTGHHMGRESRTDFVAPEGELFCLSCRRWGTLWVSSIRGKGQSKIDGIIAALFPTRDKEHR